MMADSVFPSTEYSLWMKLNVFMRIFKGSSRPGSGSLGWRSLEEQTGEGKWSLFDSFIWLQLVNSLDPERPVFNVVTMFWTKCSFDLSLLCSLKISSQDLKDLCKVSAGSEVDLRVWGALGDRTGSSIKDLELLLRNLNAFLSLDTNFLLDFLTVPGLQLEQELSEVFETIPWSLMEWCSGPDEFIFRDGDSLRQLFTIKFGKLFWEEIDSDVLEQWLAVVDWYCTLYTWETPGTSSLSIILSNDSTENDLDGSNFLEYDDGFEIADDDRGELSDELLSGTNDDELVALPLEGESKELFFRFSLGMYLISRDPERSFQNGKVNLRRWSLMALMPRRTLGYEASSSLMMGIIFLRFASAMTSCKKCYLS